MSPVTRGRNDLWGGLLLALGIVLAITALAGVSLFQVSAAGFFTWLAVARKQGWAWIPAAIFGFNVLKDLLNGISGSFFFPLMVITAGVLVLSRDRLGPGARFAIFGCAAALAAITVGRDTSAPPVPVLHPHNPLEEPVAPAEPDPNSLPELDGRKLVVIADVADIRLSPSTGRAGSIESDDGYEVSEDDDLVTVLAEGSDDMEIEVPAEAEVEVRTIEGDVIAVVRGYGLEVETENGQIEVEATTGAFIRARTDDGEIRPAGFEDTDPSESFFASAGGTGLPIELETESGDIDIRRRAA